MLFPSRPSECGSSNRFIIECCRFRNRPKSSPASIIIPINGFDAVCRFYRGMSEKCLPLKLEKSTQSLANWPLDGRLWLHRSTDGHKNYLHAFHLSFPSNSNILFNEYFDYFNQLLEIWWNYLKSTLSVLIEWPSWPNTQQ